jgi:O-antigen/teichoic acid export membrane protein
MLTYVKLLTVVLIVLSKITFGILKCANGLIVGDVIGKGIVIILIIYYYRNRKAIFLRIEGFDGLRQIRRRYSDWPIKALPDGLLDTISSGLVIFMFALMFSPENLGLYSMASALVTLPVTLLGTTISDVFKRRVQSDLQEGRAYHQFFSSLIIKLNMIAIPIAIFLAFILPDLLLLVLGEKWRVAGTVGQYLVLNALLLLTFQAISPIFVLHRRLDLLVTWQILSLSINILALAFIYFMKLEFINGVIIYTSARCLANSARLFLSYRLVISHGC